MNKFKLVMLVAAFALVGVAFASGAGSQDADDPDRGVGEADSPPASNGDVGSDDRDQTGEGGALDQVILDDLIVDGSACIGLDCVNGESFGFDTIRIKENNLRIRAQDTSTSASFPTNDWQITFNDSSNGGLNHFSIDDIDGGRTPFRIEAGAPSSSLYVDDGGRIGLGTNTPVVDVHVKSGNTPTLRLEQDGTSGFTPQIWDVAGNETNFFIRDATNGSRLPFRIFPNAPTNSIAIEGTTGDVGLGTTSPVGALHISTGSADTDLVLQQAGTDPETWTIRNNQAQGRLTFRVTSTGNTPFKFDDDSNENLFRVGINTAGASDADVVSVGSTGAGGDGELQVQGSVVVDGAPVHPDYVFEPDYDMPSIAEHAAAMWANKHLPAVGPGVPDGNGGFSVDLGDRAQAQLEELELAHVFIDQLNQQIAELEQRIAELEGS